VWHDQAGGARFANWMRADGRFLDRHWPVFRRTRRRIERRRPCDVMASPCGQKVNRSIVKSAEVSVARHWLPCNPLFAHAMKVEDAWCQIASNSDPLFASNRDPSSGAGKAYPRHA
jgi:hypothetical protein